MRSEKIQWWFIANANKMYVITAVFSFIFVMIWGNYPQWEYEEEKESYDTFFSTIDARISFVRHSSIGNNLRIILDFDATALSPDDLKTIIPGYKSLILNRICNNQDFLDDLYNGYYYDVDLRDISTKYVFKNYFNLIIKYERCAT
ncbi:hypothetical protein [Echinimonas agarilytica]|uniref:Uncharacterized protein n=1 Tax=Echinimonas agarilytica TaxID=1215918 RepID=A0AA41W8P1_9GAMM|nr:hypothetical protein [Echinimonas agarilytica]MCM2681110.1 hypothetical protein [Echinimonas agarilytica]